MKNLLLVWAHPRDDSLTARVAAAVKSELNAVEVAVTELDLYRMGFDPSQGLDFV